MPRIIINSLRFVIIGKIIFIFFIVFFLVLIYISYSPMSTRAIIKQLNEVSHFRENIIKSLESLGYLTSYLIIISAIILLKKDIKAISTKYIKIFALFNFFICILIYIYAGTLPILTPVAK